MFSQLIYKLTYKYNKMIKPAASCALLIAAFVFWNLSVSSADDAKKQYGDMLQMRSGSRITNTEAMESILEKRNAEEENIKYTAWTQVKSLNIVNDSLGLSFGADKALLYYGDNHGAFNLILDNGCALSEKTAFGVFGTTENIQGESVMINGERYVLEKLLNGEETAAIIKATEESNADFDAVDIIRGQGNTASVSEIQMNYHISGDIVIDYGSVIKIVRAAARAVLWIALMAAVLSILVGITKDANRTFRMAAAFCGAAMGLIICYAAVGLPVYIPDGLVPTRWSEFEFWSNTFAGYGDTIRYYFFMKTYVPDTLFRGYMLKTLFFSLLAAGGIGFGATLLNKMIKERGIHIGIDNVKKYYKAIREFGTGGGE